VAANPSPIENGRKGVKKLAIGISGVTGAQVRQTGGKREADLHSVIFDHVS
jgi:hypothetical protein